MRKEYIRKQQVAQIARTQPSMEKQKERERDNSFEEKTEKRDFQKTKKWQRKRGKKRKEKEKRIYRRILRHLPLFARGGNLLRHGAVKFGLLNVSHGFLDAKLQRLVDGALFEPRFLIVKKNANLF